MLLFILWTAIMGPLGTVEAEDSCYADEDNPYVLFSTYTGYEFVHGNSDDPVDIPCKHCSPHILAMNLFMGILMILRTFHVSTVLHIYWL
jgi:hypothetical protein